MPNYTLVSTGLTSGIGSYTNSYIEKNGKDFHHVMVCRDPSKVAKKANLTTVKCDLSSIASTKNALEEIKSLVKNGKIPPIKTVLFNAGVSNFSRTVSSKDGFECTFHVNVISPYLFARELIPLLKEFGQGRFVVTGSHSHFADKEHTRNMVPKPYWDDSSMDPVIKPVANPADANPETMEAGLRSYATSKLALLYLFHELARRNPQVKFLVYEPGFVLGTGLGREASLLVRLLMKPAGLVFWLLGWSITKNKSGYLMAKAVFDDELFAKVNNMVYCDLGKIIKSSEDSYNVNREKQLLDTLERIV
ncbi:unnamed protein product [Kuraishia capsulata CBS 1993]|uniref:NAD(P)-binding protein n=1 Tax=Kuraishia capsulata CBS 1993 TaxID=1382522 RepID=W6MU41_9ASCO|nr:uncharacterized protein KUCA_T00006043001 [Kuraishia capsulata CBS 1993]CDK30048.1 unnamed protein product [Kuraishia capsulata CBS 1993]